MISVKNISAGYGGKFALKEVSIDINSGDFVGLIGPNGSGKTTFLRVLSNVLIPKAGQILLQGDNLQKISKRKLAKTIAYLPQDISLNLSFTVREIALMGRSPHLSRLGRETNKDFEITDRAMRLADVSHLSDRLITELSGGEKQRALIAMCLAQEPKVLLLDEPTSHLDVGHKLSFLDLIRKLNYQSNMTVIAVFHDLNLAAEYCHKLMLLDQGQVESLGLPKNVLTSDMIQKVYGAKVLTENNPISQKPHIILAAGMNYSETS